MISEKQLRRLVGELCEATSTRRLLTKSCSCPSLQSSASTAVRRRDRRDRPPPGHAPPSHAANRPVRPRDPNQDVDERPEARAAPRLGMCDMPPEIHHAIADFLDDVDGTCLALANRYFYQLHRRRRGAVPLSTGRRGPNDQEWAWRNAGQLLRPLSSPSDRRSGGEACSRPPAAASSTRASARGPFWCRMCGFSRCELHRHIREWMPRDLEYCPVSDKYVPLAVDGDEVSCYRRSPKNHRLCGKHSRRGSTASGQSPKSAAAVYALQSRL